MFTTIYYISIQLKRIVTDALPQIPSHTTSIIYIILKVLYHFVGVSNTTDTISFQMQS
jgi:hypothetical protein